MELTEVVEEEEGGASEVVVEPGGVVSSFSPDDTMFVVEGACKAVSVKVSDVLFCVALAESVSAVALSDSSRFPVPVKGILNTGFAVSGALSEPLLDPSELPEFDSDRLKNEIRRPIPSLVSSSDASFSSC